MTVRLDGAAPIAADLAARYTPLFEIGRGGMGTIEVALEAPSERIVALKRMIPHAAREPRQTEMFLREARLAATLIHPNVVHAFDFGESGEGGELFLALEYVEGETLSAIVSAARTKREDGLPPALVASILADVCEGLHAAHELRDLQTGARLNVIHRDVSPHNVMVSYEGHVKLLDFGVAKIDSIDPLTRTGEVKGKTAYMSPEQGMGDPLDRRSDLFSLGAVLYECVCGHRMYGTGTELEVLRRLALEEPPSLAVAAPWAPLALVELHAKLVARSPDDRPRTALAVAQELRAFVAASGVGADAAAIAEVMTSLFGREAAERKRLLNEALAKRVPPARVEVLRRSLAGPTALAALSIRPHAPPLNELLSLPPIPPTGAPPAPIATRSGVLVSALVGLVLAGGVVAFTARAPQRAPAPTVLPDVAPPAPTTTPTASNASPSIPALSPLPLPLPLPSKSTSTPSPSAPPRPHHPKPTPSAHKLDVDTNPL